MAVLCSMGFDSGLFTLFVLTAWLYRLFFEPRKK